MGYILICSAIYCVQFQESGIFIPQQGRMGGGRSAMNGGFGFPPTAGGAFGDFFGMPSTGMMGKDVIQTIREKTFAYSLSIL